MCLLQVRCERSRWRHHRRLRIKYKSLTETEMFLSHSNAVPKMHANYLDKRSSYKEYNHGQKIWSIKKKNNISLIAKWRLTTYTEEELSDKTEVLWTQKRNCTYPSLSPLYQAEISMHIGHGTRPALIVTVSFADINWQHLICLWAKVKIKTKTLIVMD